MASDLVDPDTGARMAMRSPQCTARLREVIDTSPGLVVLAGHSVGGFDITEAGGVVHVDGASHFGFMSQPARVADVLARIAQSIT